MHWQKWRKPCRIWVRILPMKNLLFLALILAALPGCTTSPTGRSQLMLVSPESAIVESRKAYLSTVDDLNKQHKLNPQGKLAAIHPVSIVK